LWDFTLKKILWWYLICSFFSWYLPLFFSFQVFYGHLKILWKFWNLSKKGGGFNKLGLQIKPFTIIECNCTLNPFSGFCNVNNCEINPTILKGCMGCIFFCTCEFTCNYAKFVDVLFWLHLKTRLVLPCIWFWFIFPHFLAWYWFCKGNILELSPWQLMKNIVLWTFLHNSILKTIEPYNWTKILIFMENLKSHAF
jgi:hypothetical protein